MDIIFVRLASVGILGKEREPVLLGRQTRLARDFDMGFERNTGFLNFFEVATVYYSKPL